MLTSGTTAVSGTVEAVAAVSPASLAASAAASLLLASLTSSLLVVRAGLVIPSQKSSLPGLNQRVLDTRYYIVI